MLAAFYKVAQQEISLLLESDQHTNVVTYYAKVKSVRNLRCLQEEDHEFIYLALTYCPITLGDMVEGGSLLFSEKVTILHELALGLKHLHALQIGKHPKPANLTTSST